MLKALKYLISTIDIKKERFPNGENENLY